LIQKYKDLPFLKFKSNSRQEIYSRRPHSHDDVSLGYIESGQTIIRVHNQKYNLILGDLVLIPSRTVHICMPEDLDSFKFQMLYFDEKWWSRHFILPPDSFKTLAFPMPLSFKGIFMNSVTKEEMAALQEETLKRAIKGVIEHYELRDIKTHTGESDIERIHQLMREMPQVSLSINQLASMAGLNKFSFIRQYSGRYGLTPHADIVNMRIQRAILLFETEMELADIALSCGFSDQSHFTRQFKLYCGLRPQEYRKGIRDT